MPSDGAPDVLAEAQVVACENDLPIGTGNYLGDGRGHLVYLPPEVEQGCEGANHDNRQGGPEGQIHPVHPAGIFRRNLRRSCLVRNLARVFHNLHSVVSETASRKSGQLSRPVGRGDDPHSRSQAHPPRPAQLLGPVPA